MDAGNIAPALGVDASAGTDADGRDGGMPDATIEPDPSCAMSRSPFDAASVRADVGYLASPELGGRAPATEGDVLARAFIADRFRCLGLVPGGPAGSYEQPFTNRGGQRTANVIGFVPGSDLDRELASEIIVVGAHHDHLGVIDGETYPGANDNASGVAGLLAIAEAVQQRASSPRRTIAFVAFGSEEPLVDPPYVEGSDFFVRMPPATLPMGRVVYMINFDMIGRYDSESLVYAMGSFAGTPARAVLDRVVGLPQLGDLAVDLGEPVDEDGDSDYFPFCLAGVPWVYFWTDDPDCYHQPCDTPDRLDYRHLASTAGLGFELVWGLADGDLSLSPRRAIDCSDER
jgi:hypothetical protein